MKCKICGHRTNSIQAMAKHYRKKHPRIMARKKEKRKKVKKVKRLLSMPYGLTYTERRALRALLEKLLSD